MPKTPFLGWGILGTGRIARTFADGLARSRSGRLMAVGSRAKTSADEFARRCGGTVRAYGSYATMLADPAVQAVYIATPHPQHAGLCLEAARAKKHILCEKPLTMNHAEALMVTDAARENGVFLMEAFMYRCHPQTARIVELIRSGAVGEVGMIRATFGFKAPFDAENRLFKNELGGGGILDVGCYTVSMARLVAGAAVGKSFENPTSLNGRARLHPETGADLYAAAIAQFPGGILATLETGVGLDQENGLRVFGSAGSLHVPHPFVPAQEGGKVAFHLRREGNPRPEEIVIHCPDPLYALEADAVGDAVAEGRLESSFMPVADSLGNMAALDAWRESAGVVYGSARPGSHG